MMPSEALRRSNGFVDTVVLEHAVTGFHAFAAGDAVLNGLRAELKECRLDPFFFKDGRRLP